MKRKNFRYIILLLVLTFTCSGAIIGITYKVNASKPDSKKTAIEFTSVKEECGQYSLILNEDLNNLYYYIKKLKNTDYDSKYVMDNDVSVSNYILPYFAQVIFQINNQETELDKNFSFFYPVLNINIEGDTQKDEFINRYACGIIYSKPHNYNSFSISEKEAFADKIVFNEAQDFEKLLSNLNNTDWFGLQVSEFYKEFNIIKKSANL